ncbi:colipase-like protein 1 [Saccopteryx leptura]|uniref:colipase-like protein 1 n=1 Tax=Saccopteryx leptura TaxID=249018 RepID=UPI00339C5735
MARPADWEHSESPWQRLQGVCGEERAAGNLVDNLELCFQSKKCKSGCCRRVPPDCESHCAAKGSEGSLCHTQMFTGLYNECPCQSNLTCVFPKNQKSFKIIYGHCKKIDKKKPATKSVF